MGTILKYLDNGEWKPFLGDVPAPSNSIVSNNTPTGDIDGTNTVFTTGQPYIPGSLEVYVNGLLQVSGIHYTETDPSTGEFTFNEAPLAGDNIVCNYMVANTATGNADTLDGYHASATPTPNTLLPLDSGGKFPINILAEPLMVDVYRNTSQSVADNTTTTVIFNTVITDTHDAYDNTTGAFTVPEGMAGDYMVIGSAGLNSSGNNTGVSFSAVVQVNGASRAADTLVPYPAATTFGGVTLSASKMFTLEEGDVVNFKVWMDITSGTGSVSGAIDRTFMQIRRIY